MSDEAQGEAAFSEEQWEMVDRPTTEATEREEAREIEETIDEGEKRGRKRKRNPDSWKRNERKRLRNAGLSYVNRQKKVVQGRAVKAKGCTTCRSKCNTHMNKEQRAEIFNKFWGMGGKNRQGFCDTSH